MLRTAPAAGEFLTQIEGRDVVVDQWQMEKLAMVARKARMLYYVPGLPPDLHGSLWGTPFADARSALAALASELPPGATVAVIPEGPYVLAKARPEAA